MNTLNPGRTFRKVALAAWFASMGVLTACGSTSGKDFSKSDVSKLAMQDYLTPTELASVRVGMSEDEVKAQVGPAMLKDGSDKAQWIYVVKQGQGASAEFLKWAVFFKKGKVDRIAALESLDALEQPPAVAEAQAKAALASAERPPVLITGPAALGTYEKSTPPAKSSSVELLPTPSAQPMVEPPAAAPSMMPVAAPAEQPSMGSQPVDSLDSAGEISDTLNQWAAAWAAKDVKKYLSFYANTFEPGKLSRKEWEAQRRARLGDRAQIRVKLSDVEVNVFSSHRATVRFKQEYASDKYQDVGNKMITVVKLSGTWKIQKEEFAK